MAEPDGNYYKTGQPGPEVIEKARENMHAKHPRTRFVNAHVAMLYDDMDKVAALLHPVRFRRARLHRKAARRTPLVGYSMAMLTELAATPPA